MVTEPGNVSTEQLISELSNALDEARVAATLLRRQFPQTTDEAQLLNIPRHMSLLLTDLENALIRLYYVGAIVA